MDSSAPSSPESERDIALDEDLQELRRACLLSPTCASPIADSDLESEFDADDEANRLLRRLQAQIQDSPPGSPSSLSPFSTAAADAAGGLFRQAAADDDDDDYETLRTIQRTLARYEAEAASKAEEVASPSTSRDNADNADHVNEAPLNLSKKFPKSAQSLFEALKKNRSCQKFIRRKLMEIETKFEVNKELRKRLKCLMDFQLACKKNTGRALAQKQDPRIRLISFHKLEGQSQKSTKKSALNFGPKENWLALDYKEIQEQYPLSLRKQPWSDDEKANLLKGIKQQCQEMFFLSSVNVQSDTEGVKDMRLLPAFLNADFDITAEKMRYCLPFIKWNRLASMYLPGRSGAECESRWLNCDDPLIKHDPWTRLEEKRLLLILQNRGIYNWINISVELGTKRTPFQCLVRYQRSLNPLIFNREWTKEEDMHLLAMVETFGDKNWQLVAAQLEGRAANQCSTRWRQTLNPKRRIVGRWSLEEDKRLKAAVMIIGSKCWNKICHFIPGRTQPQCRERWVNCLEPAVNHKPWSKEEDSLLLEAVKMHGRCWSIITNFVPSRTDNQCWRRWKLLCPQENVQHEVARKIKRTMLISNFVQRKSERPEICPDDFAIVPEMINFNDKADETRKARRLRLKKRKDGNSAKKAVKQNPTGNLQCHDKTSVVEECHDKTSVVEECHDETSVVEQCHDKTSVVEDPDLTAASVGKRKRSKYTSLENGNNKDGTMKRRKMVKIPGYEKKMDPAWAHAEKVEGSRTHWKCKYCDKIFKGGGISRVKMHIAGFVGDVVRCPAVPQEIRESTKSQFEKAGKKPEPRKMKHDSESTVATFDGSGPLKIGLATGHVPTPGNGKPKRENQKVANKVKLKEQKATNRDENRQGKEPKPVMEKQKEMNKERNERSPC